MSTIREQIVVAALAALTNGRPSGVPAPERTRSIALEVAQLPSTVLVPHSETTERIGGRAGPITQRELTVALEHRATGGSGHSPDQAVEAQLAWAVRALAGNRLGGLAIDTRETGTEWDYPEGEVPSVRATQTFEITYTTRVADAEQRV